QCTTLYTSQFTCAGGYACTLAAQVAGFVDNAYRTTAEITAGTGSTICSGTATAEQHAQLAADSPTATGSILRYKKTRLDFVYGKKDCSIGVPPGGVSFANKI